ncbi:hypothetical protein LEP1GSC103_2758 [Leptospira borgpetersenii serovar Javanica str. UI 09931]|uniref:Uncharacterized protein n=4 Tax=Leptospira borgpetersenii TaxID=174 RepID=M3HMY0_LEPBO|nr:hypothetical protein LBBP_00277 [Leptospira borgpetersenii serovar Ballum]EKP12951.1 hypothetical protein LEP1GSC128_3386 [Leptospira borgpetersenii str. 200801926]EKQ92221.1 hypothetical protein LEP1GSC101_3102 [Leptospira borgpetersenii str. UI 09149]EKQ98900.1 hypothetical protein LEP1GSC121_0542 [Leptospira borgpetersenii serovar Castellonis str. 200801910]EMF99425.1 hypothetical protein LEP1GSC123_4735 [Leptospira borgpetersenii str. 200701203]EMK13358.1 hypothetical protein LEP1GSC066
MEPIFFRFWDKLLDKWHLLNMKNVGLNQRKILTTRQENQQKILG